MNPRRLLRYCLWLSLITGALVLGHPFPGTWDNGAGASIHYQPVQWPSEPSPASCGDACGDWKPYTRFGRSIKDPRVQDPSNGGTAPQNYVNVSSSCSDKSKPSIYYYLHRGATAADDVVMFRWRVEQPAHNYATGPSPGNYSASSPWSSAQWTVLFNIDGSGYRSLAAHLNGSSGSPSEPIDMLAGIWSNSNNQSIDYTDPNVHLLAHNPTAFIGPTGKLMNFHSSMTPNETWSNGAAETVWDYGTTRATVVTTSPCTEYFIDYQIPVAMLDATGSGGPSITRDTPISMLFCTANSLSNPFQKDCAINRQWSADAAKPAPFGDYLSFNKDEPYAQPIVTSVSATAPQSCPGSYTLTTKIQDALAVQSGVVVNTIKSAQFYYWYDSNGDGQATAADTGSTWTRITPAATLVSGTLNTFTASWNATSLPKGKYLVGVQAVDDNTLLDDGMTASGVDNRTFSYLDGDAENKIYIAGSWQTGQQVLFPGHSPSQSPSSAENWYGNPSVTGVQTALVGTAINACGVAPTIALAASPTSVAASGTVNFTMTVTNPSSNSSAITVSSVGTLLPTGFTYTNASSSGTNGLPSTNPSVSGQQLTWSLGSPISLSPGASATLSFATTASSNAGNYSGTASATTSFGSISSDPALITVDSARLSLSMTPSAYSIAADGSTQLVYSIRYANDSGVTVTGASISDAVPAGVTYVSCSGGASCSNSAGTVTWSLGTLAGGVSGTVTMTITVPSNYSTFSVANSATLTATAPDTSTVTKTASTTVAVTGVSLPGTPAFTLTNVASATAIAPAGSVTFTLTYTNYGTGSASSVVLTNTLPSGLTYSSCTGSCVNSSGTQTWTVGTVASGASTSVTITASAANPFTATNPALDSASISWTGGTPVTATSSVGVTGQSCSTYYFRSTTANVGFDGTKKIANTSPALTAGNTGTTVTVTAPVSGAPFLEALRFYQDPQTENDVPFDGNITSNIYIDRANGQGLNIQATVYDYNSSTGATTQLGQSTTLFNGSTKGLLTVTVTPSGTLAKGHRLLWVYGARSNHASQTVQAEFQYAGTVTNGISGGSTFANSYAAYCITPPATLTLSNTVSASSVTEATTPTLKYTLTYANTGSANATNTTLVAALPSNFTSCQYSSDNSSWNNCSSPGGSPPSHSFSLGTVAGGGSATVYVRGAVPSGTTAPSTLTATSSISSDQTSSVSASAATAVVAAGGGGGTPALALSLAANRSTAVPGNTVVYTLTVINTGSAAATNVVVSDTVPANGYYTYTSCTGGCGAVGNVLTWPTIASLAAGASQSYTYTMTVATSGIPAGVTTISDDAAASGDSALSATSNTVSVAINGNPTLVLLNNPAPSTGLLPGDDITYTLSVANTGAADASTVVVSNPIPSNTAFKGNITASQGTGTFDTINNRVVFSVGTLASGATVTLSFKVTINSPLPSGNTTITDSAIADSANAAQQVAASSASASAAPVLTITKIAPTSVAYPSATLTAAASGTTLFVDRTDRLQVNQLIKVGSQVARITALSAKSLVVDSSITASSGAAVNGGLTFALAYANTGNANATSVVVEEPLSTGFAYYSSSPAATIAPAAGGNGNIDWSIGTLAAGASGSVEIVAFPSGTTGSFTQVSSIVAGNATTATASSTTQIGGLTLTKSTSTAVISAGNNATYTITITNSLNSIVNPVSITDKLPQGFSYATSTATVGSTPTEPTFAVDDLGQTQPTWSGLSIPANGSLSIQFQAASTASAGAGGYQNEVTVSAPGGIGVMNFDPLLTTAEDVTVLAASSGVLKGYVFKRPSGNTLAFNPTTDTPLSGVRVNLHKAGADCDNPVGGNCVVVYTDSNGYFEHAMAAEDWIVTVVENTGDLPNGWYLIAGSNDNTVSVPNQSVVWDYNGYSSAAPVTHTVSTSPGANGGISPASRTVNDGNTTTFTITANSGYSISAVNGCNGSLSGATYTTDNITADCVVSATFISNSVPSHTVTAIAGTGGDITPASSLIADGNTTTLTVTPDLGYSIVSVSGCGGSLSGNTFTTGAITTGCTVTATFSINTYLVSTNAGGGGSIAPTSATANHGSNVNFTVTPDAGFNIDTVTGCGGSLSGTTYTTGPITNSCTVNATFTAGSTPTHTVSTISGTGGSLTPSSRLVVDGNSTTFTVTPNAGYSIGSVSGCSGGLSGNTYTTSAITSSCTVTASFNINTYTVTASAGSGGSIGPSSTSVNHGSTTSFTVTPNTGYSIASVSGCAGGLSGNTYTTGAITNACAVTATFTSAPVTSHVVSTTSNTGGSLSPTSVSVNDGNTTSFTIAANTGYHIVSVTGCGGTRSGNTYTTGPITNACTVSATFAINTYTVTATAGTGGSITPASSSVDHGNTKSLTVTPNSSYVVDTISGCAGTLSATTYTTGTITGDCTVTATFKVNAPLFGPAPPVSINARSLFTDVPMNIKPTATDGNGNALIVTLVGDTKLRSGRHTLTWSATDAQGHTMTTTQQLDIWPMVTISEDLAVGFGSSGTFYVVLSGDSPVYPFSINYTVTGDGGLGTLHNLAAGAATFASGTEYGVTFNALPQGTSMPTKHLLVSLDPAANLGDRAATNISLLSSNAAPQTQIVVTQAGRDGTLIARDDGTVTLQAVISDPNPLDTHTVEWTYPASAAVQISGNGRTLTVNPQSLSVGLQDFGVLVTDSGTPSMSARGKTTLAIRANASTISAGDGNDNGIPDTSEQSPQSNVLPEDLPVTDQYLVEGDPGVRLKVGGYSQLAGNGVRVPAASVNTTLGSDVVTNVGGVFDVAAIDLATSGQLVRAVIPQRAPIPANPSYRVWDAQAGRWFTFIENGTNVLSSAPGEAGYCPPPGHSAYTPGLTAGNLCVQITVEDGGANDADRQRNSAMSITGGIGQRENSIVIGSSTGGGGSMGMVNGLLAFLLAMRTAWRRHTKKGIRYFFYALALTPLAVNAEDCNKETGLHCYYLGANVALVRNSAGESDMDARLRDQGYITSTTLKGQTRFGGELLGGYRWEKWAMEVSYEYLGRMDTVVEGLTPVDDEYLRAISAAHPRSGEGPQASALYHVPFSERWEAFARGGAFWWRNTLSAEGFNRYADIDGRQWDVFFGLGVQRRPLHKRWSARGEWRLYKLEGETVHALNVGVSFRL